MQTPKATVTPDHKLAVERIQAASSWATRWRCPAHSTKGQALRFRLKTETRLFPSVYNSDSFPGALGKKKQVKYSFSNLGTREETPQSAFTITAPGTCSSQEAWELDPRKGDLPQSLENTVQKGLKKSEGLYWIYSENRRTETAFTNLPAITAILQTIF